MSSSSISLLINSMSLFILSIVDEIATAPKLFKLLSTSFISVVVVINIVIDIIKQVVGKRL